MIISLHFQRLFYFYFLIFSSCALFFSNNTSKLKVLLFTPYFFFAKCQVFILWHHFIQLPQTWLQLRLIFLFKQLSKQQYTQFFWYIYTLIPITLVQTPILSFLDDYNSPQFWFLSLLIASIHTTGKCLFQHPDMRTTIFLTHGFSSPSE